jgi:hypothetical protein
VALSVDKTRFFDHFFSVVNNAKQLRQSK